MTTIHSLIRDLHAAGWKYRITHEESPRDSDGAPWHDGWYTHRWSRGTAEISVARLVDGGLDSDVVYISDAEDDGGDGTGCREHVFVGLALVKRHGADLLRGLGDCAGVFEPVDGKCPHGYMRGDHHWFGCMGVDPFEPSSRPAPVGSWWETPDGAAYVDGDYLDGPGDQIVTYVLHRPDGSRSWGKWGGREFADAYTRLDGPPAWYATSSPDLTDGSDLPKLCGHGVNADCECGGNDQPAESVWNPDTITWSDEDEEATR